MRGYKSHQIHHGGFTTAREEKKGPWRIAGLSSGWQRSGINLSTDHKLFKQRSFLLEYFGKKKRGKMYLVKVKAIILFY